MEFVLAVALFEISVIGIAILVVRFTGLSLPSWIPFHKTINRLAAGKKSRLERLHYAFGG